jgi:hypothetical protein
MGLFRSFFQGVVSLAAPYYVAVSVIVLFFLLPHSSCSANEEVVESSIQSEHKNATKASEEIDIDSLLDDLTAEHIEKKDVANSATEATQNADDTQASLDISITTDQANMIILNKITTKSQNVVFHLGEKQFFGNLSIEIHKCVKNTDPFNPNDFMLLTVLNNKIDDDGELIFHGWVVSSAPALSNLEHPIYEIIPKQCIVDQDSTK